jgi:hypothetical protein
MAVFCVLTNSFPGSPLVLLHADVAGSVLSGTLYTINIQDVHFKTQPNLISKGLWPLGLETYLHQISFYGVIQKVMPTASKTVILTP